MSASAAAVAAVGFGQAVVLRHLLTPRDFGLMGMMWVAVGFVQKFSDMGMSNAIVHRQDATAEQLDNFVKGCRVRPNFAECHHSANWALHSQGYKLVRRQISAPLSKNVIAKPDSGGHTHSRQPFKKE
jgi:hypothetical protein